MQNIVQKIEDEPKIIEQREEYHNSNLIKKIIIKYYRKRTIR